MSLIDLLTNPGERAAQSGRIWGAVVGLVTNNQDPDGLGRVKIKFPWLSDEDESTWARMATPMAGNERGFFFLPEVDDEVLVLFEHGDPRFPYVIGSLWNGKDKPPETNEDGKDNIRLIKSRSGHLVRLTDTDGSEMIEIIDKSGNNSLVFDTANNTITITADKDIVLSATNGTIKLDAQKVEIQASADTKIDASGNMNVQANGNMTIKGSMVNIN